MHQFQHVIYLTRHQTMTSVLMLLVKLTTIMMSLDHRIMHNPTALSVNFGKQIISYTLFEYFPLGFLCILIVNQNQSLNCNSPKTSKHKVHSKQLVTHIPLNQKQTKQRLAKGLLLSKPTNLHYHQNNQLRIIINEYRVTQSMKT